MQLPAVALVLALPWAGPPGAPADPGLAQQARQAAGEVARAAGEEARAASEETAAGETAQAAGEAAQAAGEDEEHTFRLDAYGYLKADASGDSSLVEPGNFARWVESPALAHEHPHFNMTARQSRLGLRITGPERDFELTGRVEIDFYGGGAENKSGPQLRHAVLEVDWPSGWNLLAGQTADLVSPRAPVTLNYTVAWWTGNVGYRRPQVRLTRRLAAIGGRLTAAVAASRTLGDDFKPEEPGDAGADSGMPTVQARVGWAGPVGDRPVEVGISGHRGEENLVQGDGVEDLRFDSWSANVDLAVDLGSGARLHGEAFTGSNLDDYFGGVGQGIDLARRRAVEATGGWLALDLVPRATYRLSVGAGIDDPSDDDVPDGGRSRNRSVWGSLVHELSDHLSAGLEVSHWRTSYRGREPGTSWRLQGAVTFEFEAALGR